jgi:predicted nucleic acid binding AN1-type Zn finger protein
MRLLNKNKTIKPKDKYLLLNIYKTITMKSEILLTLIKEVVKNEVKLQVKEELVKLIKSGAVTLNSQKKTSTPSLREMTEVTPTPVKRQQPIQQRVQQPQREFTKDPMINEILNMTQPFTAAHRAEGNAASIGGGGGSVLDMLQPQQTIEEDWETMDFRGMDAPQNIPQQLESTGDALQDATIKALTRDYSALTKVFAEQEKKRR